MSELKLHAMTCGWMTMPYGFFMAGQPGEIAIPIPSYFIEHPKGTVLFDSGLEKRLQDQENVKEALGIFGDFTGITFLPGEDIAERLKSFGQDPEKIDYLINSHLHFDHCDGNESITNARLVIQKREWQSAVSEQGIEANHYFTRNYDHGHDRLEVDGEHDLFGDGSVVLFPSYGHTPGHQSLKVKVDGKDVILTSDACYLKAALQKMMLPDAIVVRDPQQMLDNFNMFKRLQDAGAILIFGHDPEQSAALTDGPLRQVTLKALDT